MALYYLERYKDALQAFDIVLDRASNSSTVWTNKGLTLSKLKMYNESLKAFDEAIKFDPNNVNAIKGRDEVTRNLS